MRTQVLALLGAGTLLLAACGGSGGDGAAQGPEEISSGQELQELVAAAQEEGQVVWYTSVPSERAEQIGTMFEEEYDIPVTVQRSGGADTLQRYLLESDAGRVQNDVLTVSDPAAFANLRDEGELLRFKPRNFEKVPKSARGEQGYWAATRVNAMVMAYRTDRVNDPPESWDDLLDDRFAGAIGHVNPNFSSGVMTVAAGITQDFGWDWYQQFAEQDPLIVRGNNQLMESLTVGEVDVAAFLNSTYVSQAKQQGEPVEWVFPDDGTYMIAAPSAVVSGAPNPNAGKLLADYLLTKDVQELMLKEGNYAARRDMPSPAGQPDRGDITELTIDYEWLAKEVDGVRDRWNQILDAETEE